MDSSVLESSKSFPVFVVLDGKKKSLLDRCLSVFADVRAGEGAGALLLALNAFVLLTAYYVLKPLREVLILGQYGAATKVYMSAAAAPLLMFLVPAYSAFASRVVRVKLISWVTLFFASHLAIFAALHANGVRVGAAYYLWLGILNYLLIGQFWAFANDLYDERTGKRLFPLVGVGSALGGCAGAALTYFKIKQLGVPWLMLLGGAGLVLAVVCTLVANRRASSAAGSVQQKLSREPIGRKGGFRLILGSRYLLLIAALIVVLNLVNTTGEFILGTLFVANAGAATGAARDTILGQLASIFSGLQNVLVLILQMFVVSRIFRFFGVRMALFILPLIAFGGYMLFALVPVLSMVMIAKGLENSADYSIQNTARQALFLPTSREVKYKAKMAIDTFFTRSGDALAALVVFAGSGLALGIRQYAMVNVMFVAVWLGLVAALAREHRKLTATPKVEARRAP